MKQKDTDLGLVVGSNLKRLIRESDCKTQQEFAYRFGTSPRNVARWVNEGVRNLDVIQQLADFFDTDVFALLTK